MKKIIRKALSMLLVAIMVFTVIPLTGTYLEASAAAKYMWPVVGNYSVSRWNNSVHYGVDITNSGNVQNPQIISTYSGTVTEVYNVCPCTGKDYPYYDTKGNYIGMVTCLDHRDTYGNLVKVLNDDGTTSVYGHLKYDSICVKVGDRVSQGQVLGLMGDSGVSTGIHLHFEIRSGTSQSSCIDLKNTSFLPANISENYTSPPTVNLSKKTVLPSGEIDFSFDAVGASSVHLYIYKGTDKYFEGQFGADDTYTRVFYETGHYSCYIVAHYAGADAESAWVGFDVVNNPQIKILTDPIYLWQDASFELISPNGNEIWLDIYYNYGEELYFTGQFEPNTIYTRPFGKVGQYSCVLRVGCEDGSFIESDWREFYVYSNAFLISYYDCEGIPSQTKYANSNISLSETIPIREGYVFIEWNTKADGTGKTYQPGDVYTANEDLTLYAMWEPAHSHSYTSSVTKNPTCTEKGIRTYTCQSCGDTYTEDIAPLDHNYVVSGITEPTCYESGFTTYACTRCDSSYNTGFVDALNHPSSSWVTVVNPTASSNGLAEKQCAYCGHASEQFIIPALVPDYVTGVSLSSHKETVEIGDEFTLEATVTPDTAKDKTVIWSSRDPEIATVSNGKVTALKPGTTAIVAETKDGGYIDFCVVSVISVASFNGSVVDNSNKIIYGLTCNLESIDEYIKPADSNMDIVLDSSKVGTGTTVSIVDRGEVIDTYEVVVFGDVDGNGLYDADDAFIVNMINAGLISADSLSVAERTAADCNHDGRIDQADFELLLQASILLDEVKQSAENGEISASSLYLDYCSVISQSAEFDAETESGNESDTAGSDDGAYAFDFVAFFRSILDLLSKIFSFIISLF